MADEELSLDEGEEAAAGGGKKKLIIIIAAVVIILGGVAAFFLMGDDPESEEQTTEEVVESAEPEDGLTAIYVAMPRPFVFNVMEGKRDRLVQIKVQLLVRGEANETLAKKHIPLLEGTLVRIFGATPVEQLRSPEGKDKLRESALEALNAATKKREGKGLIQTVLFTGFVLQ